MRGFFGNDIDFTWHLADTHGYLVFFPTFFDTGAVMAKSGMTYVPTTPEDFQRDLPAFVKPLRVYARYLTRSATNAEDLTQDTLLKAMEFVHAHGQRPPPEKMEAWMMRVMRNLSIDIFRKSSNHNTLGGDDAFWQLVAEDAHSETDHDLRMDIAHVLAKLSDIQRRVLIRVDVERYSYKEVAAENNIPIGTVMSRLHAARTKARDMLLEAA